MQVILKDVCPDTSTPSTSPLPSLETLASLLLDSQKPPDVITRTDDVIKALNVWVSCFDRLGAAFQAETGEIPLMPIFQQPTCSYLVLQEQHGLYDKRLRT